eukprot:TRINITY_DN106186_c0_g1_i1.p1 TRINITY_DN106186_c0_g1~~TRINITY_DN106186_c0_g1_i1.p1  ORF type:complete len:379 (+),score=59.59 TRINITY_DN106186_c0_g1_i1:531-1667(+)
MELQEVAVRLLGLIWQPTAALIVDGFHRALCHGRLGAAFMFLASEWEAGRMTPECIQQLKELCAALPEMPCTDPRGPARCQRLQPDLRNMLGRCRPLDIFMKSGLGLTGKELQSSAELDELNRTATSSTHGQRPTCFTSEGDAFKSRPASKNEGEDPSLMGDSNAEKACAPAQHNASSGSQHIQQNNQDVSDGDEKKSGEDLPPLPTFEGNAGGFSSPAGMQRSSTWSAPPGNLLSAIFAEQCGSDVLWGSQAPKKEQVPLGQICFTQRSISQRFLHGPLAGQSVEEVACKVAQRCIDIDMLAFAVVSFRQQYWTLNNRSLMALRLAQKQRSDVILASVAVFPACPATAKFIELVSRNCSLLGLSEDAAKGDTQGDES